MKLTTEILSKIVKESLSTILSERTVIKTGKAPHTSNMGGNTQAPLMQQQPSLNEIPQNDGVASINNGYPQDRDTENMPNGGKSQFDTNFDAGVEADEESDPKHYIQQLTGKLSQTLNSFNKENDDESLNKYVIKMISAATSKHLSKKAKKEVIEKIESSSFDNGDLDSEEIDDEEMDNSEFDNTKNTDKLPTNEDKILKKNNSKAKKPNKKDSEIQLTQKWAKMHPKHICEEKPTMNISPQNTTGLNNQEQAQTAVDAANRYSDRVVFFNGAEVKPNSSASEIAKKAVDNAKEIVNNSGTLNESSSTFTKKQIKEIRLNNLKKKCICISKKDLQ